jgi:hypothetical protein
MTTSNVNTISHSKAADLLECLGIICEEGSSMAIDTAIRLQGTIKTGQPSESVATVRVLSLATFASVLRMLGAVRQSALDITLDAIRDSANPDYVQNPADLEFVEMLKREISNKLPPIKSAGKRTGSLLVSGIVQQPIMGQSSLTIDKQPMALA